MRLNQQLGLAAAALASILAFGCNPSDRSTAVDAGGGGYFVNVPMGSQIDVRLKQSLSSETARRGDRWEGVVMYPVVIGGREVIPSGATVEGVVVAAEEARRGSRARLQPSSSRARLTRPCGRDKPLAPIEAIRLTDRAFAKDRAERFTCSPTVDSTHLHHPSCPPVPLPRSSQTAWHPQS
jgi:hypothetical protein